MFLLHAADIELDGNNPTVLYGYGGFDISLTPAFSEMWLPWVSRGGVYAIANLRRQGLPEALTGPIRRGDRDTVARHLQALANSRELSELYRLLGRRLLPLARDRGGADAPDLAAIAEVLELPLSYFLDEGVGPVGERQQREKEWRLFVDLDAEVRAFVLEPANRSYLQLAMSLSDIPADGLRNIAANLLEITF